MSPNQPPEALNEKSATEMLISAGKVPWAQLRFFKIIFQFKIQLYLNFCGSAVQPIVIFLDHKELADKTVFKFRIGKNYIDMYQTP